MAQFGRCFGRLQPTAGEGGEIGQEHPVAGAERSADTNASAQHGLR
jgi:hypothetical protein